MKQSPMMKSFWCSLVFTMLVAISASFGCSKKVQIDTVNLEYSFQTASDETLTKVTEAIEAIEASQYDAALEKLKTVSADTNLTAEQKTAVTGVISQIEKR